MEEAPVSETEVLRAEKTTAVVKDLKKQISEEWAGKLVYGDEKTAVSRVVGGNIIPGGRVDVSSNMCELPQGAVGVEEADALSEGSLGNLIAQWNRDPSKASLQRISEQGQGFKVRLDKGLLLRVGLSWDEEQKRLSLGDVSVRMGLVSTDADSTQGNITGWQLVEDVLKNIDKKGNPMNREKAS